MAAVFRLCAMTLLVTYQLYEPRAVIRDTACVLIQIEGTDLPGRSCGPGPDFPDGHHNIHVAVQGRKGHQDVFGLTPADAPAARWEIESQVVSHSPIDLRGPHLHGSPGHRFIYLTWGVVAQPGSFTMFRRAKLLLDAVPEQVLTLAAERGRLIGRVGLTDTKGWPLCASVRPPRIAWSV
jgi:Family of unknown function (DUF5990)